jgi:isocitrate lyase
MTLLHLFLLHRYGAVSVHYVSPTDDNQLQAESMKGLGLYRDVTVDVGQIIVATVHAARVAELVDSGSGQRSRLIAKQ